MNQSEIKQIISQNLTSANLTIDDLRVQPDSFLRWRIVVISSGFVGKSQEKRRELVLKGLENLSIEWLELMTPDEREWAGTLPIDSDLTNLPLWSEALARSKEINQKILFPSDLDEDLKPPIITTFYSLRGGVGRSTALAYTALILARKGFTVLCVDLDLEAPGLPALFGKENEVNEETGLLSLLLELDQGGNPNVQDHIIRISETEELYCLSAGKPNANYARLLNFIDVSAWYREERNPLRDLIDILSHDLTFQPHVILLDARTGITPLNAPLLFDLADLAIVTFFPHPQAKEGTSALVKALFASNTRRQEYQLTPEPRFLVSPIPASKAPEVIERYQHRSLEWISNWFSVLSDQNNPIIESEITHFIPYLETIATSDQVLTNPDVWRDFEPVAEWVELFLPTRSEQILSQVNLGESKQDILKELEFSAGTAEYQENFLETFVSTELVNRALEPKTPLVLGGKGTGKTAIFRRITEGFERKSIIIMSPNPLKKDNYWVISIDGFKEIQKTLQQNKVTWREFWMLQICLACYFSQPEKKVLPDESLGDLNGDYITELQLIKLIQKMLNSPQIGLLARDWLQRLDKEISTDTILLFDGLDTGFGNAYEDRVRRSESIEGLLSLVTDIGDNLHSLRFKILLREDIWRKLKLENKSHFFGRSVTLTWSDKIDFLKVVIKQALRSEKFLAITHQIIGQSSNLLDKYDYWLEEQIIQVWNVLVGERMKGGKSAFTRNWVWNRLADGSGNHSPRALLQLFFEAKEWEKKEQHQNIYNKTIIRPRALNSSLEKVSERSLDALISEEFPELQDLINSLKDLGRSPFQPDEIAGFSDDLSLALEVGLLSIYEGTEDNVKRYKVPDLYRLGIGMRSKGQA